MTGRPRSGKNCPEIIEQLAPSRYIDAVDDPNDAGDGHDPHVYVGERCIRCDVNIYDAGLDSGPDTCSAKDEDEQIVYSTTGEQPVSSHPIAN